MFWDNVVKFMVAQGTFLAIVLGAALLSLILIKVLERASIAYVKYVSLSAIRWPKIPPPNVVWKQISEPVRKATKMILVIVALMAFGVVAPLAFAFWLAGAANVVDPLAYVTAGVILSFFVVSLGGLYLFIKQRNVLREMGLYVFLCYIIAISWLAALIAGLPMAISSD